MNSSYRNAAAIAQPKSDPFLILINTFAFLYVCASFILIGWIGLSRACLALAVMLAIVVVLKTLMSGGRFPKLFFLPWLFVIFSAMSIMWSKDIYIAYEGVGQTCSVILAGTAIWQGRNQGLSWKTVVWGEIIGSVALILSTRGEVAIGGLEGRAAGWVGNSNLFALSLSYAAFVIWCSPQKLPMWMHAMAGFFAFYSFAFSGSRKTLLVLGVAAFAVVAWGISRIRKPSTWAMLAGGVILCILLLGYIQAHSIDVMESLNSISSVKRMMRFFTGSKDVQEHIRQDMIWEALELWKQSPIIGHGSSQFSVVSSYEGYSHNNYSEILANYGLVGFILYYSFHGILLSKSFYYGILKRSPPHRRVIVLIMLVLLLDVGTVSYYGKCAWILLGMAASLTTAEKSQDIRVAIPVTRFRTMRIPGRT